MTAPDTDTLAGLLAGLLADISASAGITWSMVPMHIAEGPSEVRSGKGWLICTTPSDELARLIALAPSLAAEVIALRAQAAKDKARIERLQAALKCARALLRSGADLLSIESEALRTSITVNGELRPDPEDAPAVEAIEEIEAWIADVADFINARAALEDRE